MKRTYNLLENILIDVEAGIKEGINVGILAKKYSLSYPHLNRLFKFTFKLPLAKYIHSRRLAESMSDLLKTDKKIINIALEYGFDYEQSYNRAFKREFGIPPGEFRKSRNIAKTRRIYYETSMV